MADALFQQATELLEGVVQQVSALIASNEGWEQFYDEDGARGYRREDEQNGFMLVKTFATIDKPADQIRNYIWDYNNKKKWDETSGGFQYIQIFDNNFRILYEQINTPWPVTNRDGVIAQKCIENENGYLIYSKSIPNVLPEVDGCVRAEIICHYIRLSRLSENQTEICLGGCVNPKGSIPKMIVNKMSSKQVGKLLALRAALA
jgi:hypothetical protein